MRPSEAVLLDWYLGAPRLGQFRLALRASSPVSIAVAREVSVQALFSMDTVVSKTVRQSIKRRLGRVPLLAEYSVSAAVSLRLFAEFPPRAMKLEEVVFRESRDSDGCDALCTILNALLRKDAWQPLSL